MSSDRTRASDAEREQIVALLRTAATEGRLDVDELDERTAQAYAAKTRGDLTRLLDDLPAAHLKTQSRRELRPAPSPQFYPQTRGVAGFFRQWLAPVGQAQATEDVFRHVGPELRAYGYDLEHHTHSRIVFRHDERPWWTYVLAVLVFPIGLLALLHTEKRRVTVELYERGGETAITVSGIAPLGVRQAFAAMER